MASGLEDKINQVDEIMGRVRVSINDLQIRIEGVTDVPLPSMSSREYMEVLAVKLNETSEVAYEIGVVMSFLHRVSRRLKEMLRTSGDYSRLVNKLRRVDEELQSWIDVYRSVSFNVVERSRALRSLLSAGQQER